MLEFAAGAGTGSSAIRVYGQPAMNSAVRQAQPSAQSISGPQGIAVDAASNLYAADTGAQRVLIFPNTQNAPPSGMAASFVIGQPTFAGGTSSTFRSPSDVAVDTSGNIYVSDTGNNRVLVYQSLVLLPVSGAAATAVIGQQNSGGTAPNWDSTDGLATSDSLFNPVGLYVDRQDTLYVSDTGNSRVLQFLKSASVVQAATFQSGVPVPQGGLATLFGAGLVGDSTTVNTTPWPTTLLNRQVVLNDELQVPIYYLGSQQVNFQVPSSAPLGADRIAVRAADTGELIAGGSVLVAATSPGLFTIAQTGAGQGAVINQDGTVNSASNAAPKGSVISLYGTGQGQVSPPVPDGNAAPDSPLSNTVAVPTSDGRACQNTQPSMCVSFGSSFGDVQYSGLAPRFVGLWQINVRIPTDITAANAVPVRVLINGTPTNTVTVAVR